ncbi:MULTISPECIES: phage baseplate assembly protein [unclassified Saccharibacter]|uniref:phage baseplate assembly protein domain-containing protein n=1 Tax=unclassified Saccharibacter TaxID=2648722 RepID=UPI001325CFF8|nr:MULTISPECIES: phage baseplate assembly protein [unclassified Saccharibacter]MXV35847.1 hypothetical protein [Saccharibacter sp. EH611]MXV57968.1 hypothetical protein [Saccharibacter sp. EH70]MXV66363.1 hypothetical protein [Saccharibacter sp. EH60]
MTVLDIYHTIRSQILRAVVKALDDSGPEQRVALKTHAGQERTAIPVHYPFGFGAHVPLDGAVTHVLQNGSDPSDLVAMPPSNPGAARLGGLQEGESVLYDSVGQRVLLKSGQMVEIDATQAVNVKIAGKPVMTVTEAGVQINGIVQASGDVTAGSISLQHHVHGGVQVGGGTSKGPTS